MYLAVINTIVGRLGEKGFYQSQEMGLARSLEEMGHEVLMIKCVPETQKEESFSVSDHFTMEYIHVKRIGIHGYLPVSRLPKTLDGVIAFADNQIFLPHIYKYCRANDIVFVPYIGIAHSVKIRENSRIRDAVHQFIFDIAFRLSTARLYRKIPVLAKTKIAKGELESYGVKNITVVPVGIDDQTLNHEFRKKDRTQLRSEYGFHDDDIVISYVQRLIPEKNPMTMMEIFQELASKDDRYKLVVVGAGICADEMKHFALKNDLDEKITFITKIPHEEIWKIHYLSDLYVTLNPREIFGMALLEAVYYESAAFAIDSAGSSAILEDMPNEYLCKSKDEIINAIRKNEKNADILRKNSNHVRAKFMWSNCAGKFTELVEEGCK